MATLQKVVGRWKKGEHQVSELLVCGHRQTHSIYGFYEGGQDFPAPDKRRCFDCPMEDVPDENLSNRAR